MNISSRGSSLSQHGIDLAVTTAEVCHIAELQNVRTEIVLKDGRDVAFWFSLVMRFAMVRQQRASKRVSQPVHQTRTSAFALFPKQRAKGGTIEFSEDD